MDFDVKGRSLTRQLKYADSLGIPFTLIVGKKELEKKKFKLRDMKRKMEKELTLSQIIEEVGEK